MESIGSIISRSMEKKGLGESMLAMSVLIKAKKCLEDLLGKTAVKHLIPKKFENNTIYIEFSSHPWAQEFQFIKYDFLSLLQQSFPEKIISIYTNVKNG